MRIKLILKFHKDCNFAGQFHIHLFFLLIFYEKCGRKTELYGPFLWMGFNCLKATATSRRKDSLISERTQIDSSQL